MPAKLRNLVIDRVDLVDKGANAHAHVLITKRADVDKGGALSGYPVESYPFQVNATGEDGGKSATSVHTSLPAAHGAAQTAANETQKPTSVSHRGTKQVISTHAPLDAVKKAADCATCTGVGKIRGGNMSCPDCGGSGVAKADPSLASVHVDTPIGAKKKPKAKETPMEKTWLQKVLALVKADDSLTEDEKAEADTQLQKDDVEMKAKGEAEKVATKKAADDKLEADKVAKKLALDTVEKRMVDLEKRATDAETRATAAETIAKTERDTRVLAEHLTILKSFTGISVDVAKDAPLLQKLSETDRPAYDRMLELLKAADAQVTTSKLFSEFGTAASGAGSAWEQIEAKAAALVTKSATPITLEKARDLVMTQNPALVRQYRAEQS